MEAAPDILRRGYEKRRRRDVARQAPSLRTEWVGWSHSAFLRWTSHDHEWDPSGPPSTGGRTVQPLATRKESPETVACTQRQTPRQRRIMRLGCCGYPKRLYAHCAPARRAPILAPQSPWRREALTPSKCRRAIGLPTLWTVHFLVLLTYSLGKPCASAKAMFGNPLATSQESQSSCDGRIVNDESKDEKVRAHTMPLRCTKWTRVLRGCVS